MDVVMLIFGAAAVVFAIAAWTGKSLTDLGLFGLALAFFIERI